MFNASDSFSSRMVLMRGINCSASSGRMGVFPSVFMIEDEVHFDLPFATKKARGCGEEPFLQN
jgi:hypothetical protein